MASNMTINASGFTIALPATHRVVGVPSWVQSLLDLPVADISFLEVTGSSPYSQMFLEYCGQVGVDVTEPPPESVSSDSTKSIEGKNRAARLYPGTLTALRIHSPPAKPMFAMRHKPKPPPVFDNRNPDRDEEDFEPSVPPVVLAAGSCRLMHAGKHVAVLHDSMKLLFFAADPATLRSLVKAIVDWNHQRNMPDRTPQVGKFELYTLSGSMWVKQAWKRSRKLTSVILPEGMMENIVDDFRRFTSKETKAWYAKHGLSHRRSYLFHGPPGTGKTSTIMALAGELQLAVCFMLLGDDEMTNSMLQKAINRIPLPCLLVIEDVDALFNEDRKTKNVRSPLTFSGLLNCLDGLLSTNGIVTIMTTNFVNRLDPALIRAGRVDRKFRFEPPTRKEVSALFRNFYPDAPDDLAKRFADKVFARPENQARSIATLHQHFIYTRESDAEKCVDAVDSFFSDFYPEGGERESGLYS